MSPARRVPPLTDAQALSGLLDDAYHEADDWHARFEQVRDERDKAKRISGELAQLAQMSEKQREKSDVLLADCAAMLEQHYSDADVDGASPALNMERRIRDYLEGR